jgi:hypothetical protein
VKQRKTVGNCVVCGKVIRWGEVISEGSVVKIKFAGKEGLACLSHPGIKELKEEQDGKGKR